MFFFTKQTIQIEMVHCRFSMGKLLFDFAFIHSGIEVVWWYIQQSIKLILQSTHILYDFTDKRMCVCEPNREKKDVCRLFIIVEAKKTV